MELDVKQRNQRNKRRERAQRMIAERDKDVEGGSDPDSADEDTKLTIEKPQRPPIRRKKSKEPSPVLEEDIIDGFAILAFKTYEDLEFAIKIANKRNEKRLSAIKELTSIMVEEKPPKVDTGQKSDKDNRDRERDWNNYQTNNHITNNNNNLNHNNHSTTHNLSLPSNVDPGTSDDSGRLTTSSVAQRDPDSSRDRLSDASSRCSSGKGYICDSEGDDDKGSDGGSVVFASTPQTQQTTTTTPSPAATVPRKSDFPTTGLPLSNGPIGLGGSASPVPVPPGPGPAPPAPSPAPAALPPPNLPPPYPNTMQVPNGPLSAHLTTPTNHSVPQQPAAGLNSKPILPPVTAKIPSSCGAPNLPTATTTVTTAITSQNSINLNISVKSPLSPSKSLSTTTTTTTTTTSMTNGSISSPPTPTNLTPANNGVATIPTSVSNGQTNNNNSNNSPPSSLPLSVPKTPPVAAPGSTAGQTAPVDNSTSSAGVLRTNSPSVATSAVLSGAATPTSLHNGTSSNNHSAAIPITASMITPNGIPAPYRGYPYNSSSLYMPYSSFNHSPYLPSAIPSPTLSPRHMGMGMPQMIGNIGLMDSRLQPPPPTSLNGGNLPNGIGRERDSSPLIPNQQSQQQQKLMRPITPNTSTSNSNLPPQQQHHVTAPGSIPSSQSSLSLRDQQPPTSSSSNSSSSATNHSNLHSTSSLSRTHSPRGHSPNRERDSYSSNVSSLSRSTATPGSAQPYNTTGAQPGPSPTLPYSTTGQALSSPAASISSSLTYTKTTSSSAIGTLGTIPTSVGWPNQVQSAQSLQVNSQLSPATSVSSSLTRPTPPPPASVVPPLIGAGPPVSIPAIPTSFPAPLFTAPLPPPVVSSASATTPTAPAPPLPFSAESLFSSKVTDQADMLRRELDNRFLDRSGIGGVTAPPYLRQELHHHQHQHTHLHQHQHQHQHQPPPILQAAPPAPAPLFPPPLFKDIPKIGAVDSPFYRTGLGLATYPGYPSLLHPGLSGPTQFVPPSHLPSFAPKKTGKWNAMHVRIAWEIYNHQAKQNPEKANSLKSATDMLRPPSHMYPPSGSLVRPHDLPSSPYPPPGMPGRPPYDTALPPSFMSTPTSHLGVSPFGRYGYTPSPFGGLTPFSRDIPMGSQIPGSLHDPWRSAIPRSVASYPPPPGSAGWPLKPDPSLDAARRDAEERERQIRERDERERERQRREREERERQREREREEKLRKEQQEREREREKERERERKEKERREMERREMERERLLQQQRMSEAKASEAARMASRDRSPLRNGEFISSRQQMNNTDGDIRVKEEPRKDDDIIMRTQPDPRFHPSSVPMHPAYMQGRHPAHLLPPSQFSRSMMPPMGTPLSHFPPPGPGWPASIDPYRDPYALHTLRSYNPLMEAHYREEERKAMSLFAAQSAAHFRSKEPSPVPPPHHRLPPGPVPSGPLKPPLGPSSGGSTVSNELHKKEDSTQSR